jgi:YbgC/YbaW family acyl-CoA thioester hydrolase
MNQKFIELKLNIKPYDIDIARHVNNIVYIKWFEQLRTKLFNNYFNLQDLLSNNLYPVVISTNISYKKSLSLFDKPLGVISLVCYNHGIITLKVEIILAEKIAAYGEQKCVLMNLTTGKMIKEKLRLMSADII